MAWEIINLKKNGEIYKVKLGYLGERMDSGFKQLRDEVVSLCQEMSDSAQRTDRGFQKTHRFYSQRWLRYHNSQGWRQRPQAAKKVAHSPARLLWRCWQARRCWQAIYPTGPRQSTHNHTTLANRYPFIHVPLPARDF
ncbi:hypothetical protein L873DRAFT_1072975 [Choiromyces venosus 120613-1]|uniref:Uncharacterized protein n=1 Tax=Choiromyces venosus 120613-1 TaxID=1336337 RepID=A0A3N4K6B7_9PEZI|nr:hypothetical protein L873DRAFT_1072975 [Choiromyces venosus 120613-1]